MKIRGQGILFLKRFLNLNSHSTSRFKVMGLIVAVTLLLPAFQNCSQRGEIALEQKLEDTDVTGSGDITPEECKDCGASPDNKSFTFQTTEDAAQLPPLKLIFIVDNSHSMYESQLNLANSFKTLFDSSSGKNLSKFDGEILIFTTAALNSIYLENFGNNIPAKDPISVMLGKSYEELDSLRNPKMTGVIPGDLMSHIVLSKSASDGGVLKQSFPTPVHGLSRSSSGAPVLSATIPFKKGGSLEELNRDFQNRLSLLDPAKYLGDESLEGATAGESALCLMSRILRDPSSFIKQGEHLSFVVVSDEDETNPQGFRCVRTVQYAASGEWTNFEYVAGNATDGPKMDLKTYVNGRLSEVLGSEKASFSFFIRLPGDPVGGSETTKGDEYFKFGQSVGAQLNSVLLPSYSQALGNLSTLIKGSIRMSYTLPLPVGATIKSLYRRSASGEFELVSSSLWSSEGNVITLQSGLNVQSTDVFRVDLN